MCPTTGSGAALWYINPLLSPKRGGSILAGWPCTRVHFNFFSRQAALTTTSFDKKIIPGYNLGRVSASGHIPGFGALMFGHVMQLLRSELMLCDYFFSVITRYHSKTQALPQLTAHLPVTQPEKRPLDSTRYPFLTRHPRSLTTPSTSSSLPVVWTSLSRFPKLCSVDWTQLVSLQNQKTTCCSVCWRSQAPCNPGPSPVLLFSYSIWSVCSFQ